MHDINTISQKDYDLAIELLSRDQLSNLLDLLNELGIDVILKKGQLAREKEEYLANRLTKSEYSVFRNKLAQSVLELVKSLTIEEEPTQSKKPNPKEKQSSDDSSESQKNILKNNTITSSGDLNLHIGDVHNHYGLGGERKDVDANSTKVNPKDTSYVNEISDIIIFKLEKFLIMSSEYQYSFSNPEYRILSFHYLEELIAKLKASRDELDEMDVERYFYSKNMTRVLKHETKIVSGLKDVLKKSKLEDSHLFSLAKRVLSNFIDTIDKIEGNEMDAADGAFFLAEKRMILMEELGRIKKTALNYSLN